MEHTYISYMFVGKHNMTARFSEPVLFAKSMSLTCQVLKEIINSTLLP